MTSSIAMPLIVDFIKVHAEEHLHSRQQLTDIGSMASLGIEPEPHRVWISKRWCNKFMQKCGLSMRRGTGNFAKQLDPTAIAAARHLMYLRMLFVTVTHRITSEFIFNFDETGLRLLWFGDIGRAQKGLKQVAWTGFTDKRQFTLSMVINGLGEVIFPTQLIWEGANDSRFVHEDLKTDDARQSEYLYHDQSSTHWTTFATLCTLVHLLADKVRALCKQQNRNFEETHWVLVMDCYSVHISKQFLKWYKEAYPMLICLYIPANYTAHLQPLDISVNVQIKRFLKEFAATWLADAW